MQLQNFAIFFVKPKVAVEIRHVRKKREFFLRVMLQQVVRHPGSCFEIAIRNYIGSSHKCTKYIWEFRNEIFCNLKHYISWILIKKMRHSLEFYLSVILKKCGSHLASRNTGQTFFSCILSWSRRICWFFSALDLKVVRILISN